MNLYWGGTLGVAKTPPVPGERPARCRLRLVALRPDGVLRGRLRDQAAVLDHGHAAVGERRPELEPAAAELRVAARLRLRGGGALQRQRTSATTAGCCPAVRLWAAWNEPNNPPSSGRSSSRGGQVGDPERDRTTPRSATPSTRACTRRSYKDEQVACGVTAPRGNNNPASARPSVSPVAFLTAAKKAGMKRFDAYAHNPYYGVPTETPTTKPPGTRSGQAPTAITLANINVLIAAVAPPVRAEPHLDHRVRLPDEPARSSISACPGRNRRGT